MNSGDLRDKPSFGGTRTIKVSVATRISILKGNNMVDKKIVFNFENLDLSDEDKASWAINFQKRFSERFGRVGTVIDDYRVEFEVTDSENSTFIE